MAAALHHLHSHYGVAPPSAVTLLRISQRAQSFLAFSSIDSVHITILNPAFTHLQSLRPLPSLDRHDHLTITAVAGHPTLGLIAVGWSDHRLLVYSPTETTPPTWSIVHDRTLSEPATALAWSINYLIVGSKLVTAISTTDWVLSWSVKCSYAPIHALVPSPDYHCIATGGKDDPLVKIWVSSTGGPLLSTPPRLHSFFYLPHPHPVTSFSWRSSKSPRVLLTNCQDGVARLWTWSSKVKQFQLHLALDPRLLLSSEQNLLPPACFWLNLCAISPRPTPPVYLSNSSTTHTVKTNPELAELLESYDELVISLQSSGTVLVYGIQNLSRRNGPISASVVKMIQRSVDPTVFPCMNGAAGTPHFVQFAFTPESEHILMIGSSASGSLACMSVDVGHLIYRPNTKLRLVHVWAGHTHSGTPILHSAGQFLVSITKGTHAIVWDLDNEHPGLRQMNGFKLRAQVHCFGNTAWCLPVDRDSDRTVNVLEDGTISYGERSLSVSSQPIDVRLMEEGDPTYISIIHQNGLAVIQVPELTLLTSTALVDVITGAHFFNDDGPYHAVTLSNQCVLQLWDKHGSAVHRQTLHIPDPVLQLAATNHSIALRTAHNVSVYSIGLVDHHVVYESTVILASAANDMSMTALPTGSSGVLAVAHTHHVSVYARRVAGSASTVSNQRDSAVPIDLDSTEWAEIKSVALNGYVDQVLWTVRGDLVAMTGHTLIVVDELPTLIQQALDSQSVSPDAPAVLREWLRWNKPQVVKAILNHRYYALAHGNTHTPVVPWNIISNAAGLDLETGGSNIGTPSMRTTNEDLDALFLSSENGVDMDLLDTKNLSLAKVNALREVLEKGSTVNDKQLLAILDAISEPESASMDDNGQRFRWEVLLYIHAARRGIPAQPLSSESIAFAFFSDDQPALVDHIVNSTMVTWQIATQLGAGWWLTHPEALRSMAEAIARNHWRKSSNPHDCFLFYLALGKRKLMLTLWKQANGHQEQEVMINFLSKDVDDAWKKQALKNAFVLIGKQRFELAAAFFLLADAPKDAVTVCLRNLKDPQLALFVVKLLGVPVSPVIELLRQDPNVAKDVSLAIMANWMDGSRDLAMDCIASPASYLLMRSVEAKIKVNYLTPTSVDPAHARQALHRAVAWYHVRGIPYFNRVLVSTLMQSAAVAPVEDDFAALFGGAPKVNTDFDDMFGGAPKVKSDFDDMFGDAPKATSDLDAMFGGVVSETSVDNKGMVDTNPSGPLELLTQDEKRVVVQADQCLTLWQAVQSIFVVGSTQLVYDLYFDDYFDTIMEQTVDASESIKNKLGTLCLLTLSPNAAFQLRKTLNPHLLLSVLMRIFARWISQRNTLESGRPTFFIKVLTQCIMTLGTSNDGLQTPRKQPYAAIAAMLTITLNIFLSLSCCRAAGGIMKNLPPVALSTGNGIYHAPAEALNVMHSEVVQHIHEEPTSRHLILEYLALRSFQVWLDNLISEYLSALDVDSVFVLCDVCVPYLIERINMVHDEIHQTQTLVQSPADDWLTPSHQDLFNALKWNSAWLDDLRVFRVTSAVSGAGAGVVNKPAIPLEERFLRLGVHNSSVSEEPEPHVPKADPIDPSLTVKIDTLFKHDAMIYGMALGPSQSNLVVAQAKSVAELDVETAHNVMHRILQGTLAEPVILGDSPTHLVDSPEAYSPVTLPRSQEMPLAVPGKAASSDEKHTESRMSPHPDKSGTTSRSASSGPMDLMKRVQSSMAAATSDPKASAPESGILDYYLTSHAQVASHPSLDYYVLADWIESSTVLTLRHYGGKGDMLRIPYGTAKVNKLEIDPVGGRFAVADTMGDVAIFGVPSLRIYSSFPCHARYTSDLVFYGSSTLFISSGSSPGHLNNVALWDTLVPVQSARVRGYTLHESGASAVAYDGRLVYSGGKKGDLHVLDMRHSRPLCSIQAHGSAISCMNVSVGASLLYSGSVDGTLKVWDISTASPTEVATFRHLHGTRKFLSVPSAASLPVSSLGLTKIIVGDGYILTSGADGAVKWLH